MKKTRRWVLAGTMLATLAEAEEWPQFGGPSRDFTSSETGLVGTWSADGPELVWSRELGEGYSSIAVKDGVLYTMSGEPAHEIVVALDAATGRELWTHRYPIAIPGDMNLEQGPGPHATPLVTGNAVFTAGVAGKLLALDRETGRALWERELLTDLGGTVVYRGYSSSPLVHGETVILPVGGKGRGVVAFRLRDGEVVWSREDFENTNASPILVEWGGRATVVVFMANVVAGLDAATGELVFEHPAPQRFHDNISTPVLGPDGLLFCSSYADGGSRVLELRPEGSGVGVRELWHHAEMRLYYTNAVRIGDFVYGSSGDLGPTFFTAVNARTGAVAWRSRALARSNFLYADGRLYLRDEEGRLSVATVTAEGVEVRGEALLFEPGPPTPPSLSGGRLYARDRKRIAAFDLRAGGPHVVPRP